VIRPGFRVIDTEPASPHQRAGVTGGSGVETLFGRDRRHERREERREARTGGPEVTRYQMRQRMISIGDDYVIENRLSAH